MRICWSCGCLILAGTLTLAAGSADDGKKGKAVEALFKKLDGNMDGKLSKDEFLKMADRAKEKAKAREKLGQAYDKLDPERKGITWEVFRRFLESRKNGNGSRDSSN